VRKQQRCVAQQQRQRQRSAVLQQHESGALGEGVLSVTSLSASDADNEWPAAGHDAHGNSSSEHMSVGTAWQVVMFCSCGCNSSFAGAS
jgi:hypothetical protein